MYMPYIIHKTNNQMKIEWTDESLMKHMLLFFKMYDIKHTKHKKDIVVEFETDYTLHHLHNKHKHFLSYSLVSDICSHLAKQMNWIHEAGYIFQELSMKDIVCLDDKYYFFTNTKDLIPSQETDITKEDNYFDLGNILVQCLLNQEVKGKKTAEEVLEPFYYTELYWCLLRCMDKDPKERSLFYI